MIEPATIPTLEELIRQTSRSLLQYISGAYPWTWGVDAALVEQVQQLAARELEQAVLLSRLLTRQRIRPRPTGPFPSYFTSYNFLALDRVLALLLEEHHRDLASAEKLVTSLPEGEVRQMALALLQTKRETIKALESLGAARPPARSA